MATSRVLPMFPLGTVLFPRASLPLHVFEPRYRVLVHDCLAGDRELGVVLIERGSEVGGGDSRFAIGTLAGVVRAVELPDGRSLLETVGLERLRVVEWLPDDPYPRASVEALVDAPPGAGASDARDAALAALREVHDLYRRADATVRALPDVPEEPIAASYVVAALAPLGPLDAQRVLEVDGAESRLRLLSDLLGDHARLVRAQLGDA